MNIPGYAFKPNEGELRQEYEDRYEEIKHLAPLLKLRKSPEYGETKFTGVLTDETRELSPRDLALIADFGNLCFGGYCVKSRDNFNGGYYVD